MGSWGMNASLNVNLAVSDSVLAAAISQGEPSLFKECQAGKQEAAGRLFLRGP